MARTLTRRNPEVVDFKRYRIKNYSKLTNFRKFTRIEGYNGKYGSNPRELRNFLTYSSNLIKSDEKSMEEIGGNDIL